MTCKNPSQELTLKFLESGIEIHPLEMDVRSRAHEYSHGQFVLNEQVGQFVGGAHHQAEPVELWFGDERAHRFYIPDDSIEFQQKLDRPTTAKLDLQDARQVLRRGNIEKHFTHVRVGEVVRYILNNRDDPNGVIQGVEYHQPADASERLTAQGQPGAPLEPSQAPVNPELISFFEDILGTDAYGDPYVGFDFEGISPLEALSRVMNEIEVDWLVDDEGIIHIGPFGSYGRVVGVAENDTQLAVMRYDVTNSVNQTNAVRIVGPYQRVTSGLIPENTGNTRLRPIAEASAPRVTGSPMYLEAKSFESLAELERAAARALFQEIMQDTNGSMVINALASSDKESIAKMQPGENILVDSSLSEYCEKDVATGAFLIEEIHHRASRREGWQVTLEVSEVAFSENVNTTAFYYDPQTEQTFDSLDSYNEYKYDEEGDELPFPIIPL